MERARRDPRRLARTAPGPGRHVGPGRHELRGVGARRDGRLGVPVRRRRHRDAVPADRAHPRRLERPGARRARRPAATASVPTGRGTRRTGSATTRTSCCSTRTPWPSPASRPPGSPCSTTTADARRAAPRDSAPSMPRSVVVHDDFDWGDDRPMRQRWRDTVIYELHVKGFTAAPQRDPRAPARHVRRPRHADGDQLPPGPRRDGGRADAGAPVLHRAGRRGARDEELLGLQLDRLLRPARRLQLVGRPRAAGHRVQADGQELPRGRHRGLPRRGLQPHGRGRGVRADVRLPGAGRPRLLQALRRPGQRLLGRHRVRQHRGLLQRGRAAADPRLAALLGHRDARRRLPLRPRVGAGAHGSRHRHAQRVPHHHRAGPGAAVRQADRRAVGRVHGRLPRRLVPAAVGGVERHVPRHDAGVLDLPRRRSAAWPRDCRARRTCTPTTAGRRTRR